MTTAILSSDLLKHSCDLTYPATGTIGYVILLTGDLISGASVTTDIALNQLTVINPHGLTTGSRVVLATSGSAPAPLVAGTEYYAIVVSTTRIAIATTLANAKALVSIDLTSVGVGTNVLNEQILTAQDDLAVLIAKELPATGGYARMPLTDVGLATVANGVASKPAKIVNLANSGGANITYRHQLVVLGATPTIGSMTGMNSGVGIATETANQVTVSGQTRSITINLGSTN